MEGGFDDLAAAIIQKVGGSGNIAFVTNCLTRVRFQLKDEREADTEALEAMDEIVAVRKSAGQYQVVTGSNASFICEAIYQRADISDKAKDTSQRELVSSPAVKAVKADAASSGRLVIKAPVMGRILKLSEIEDTAFASGALGEGIAIEPYEGKIYAPCDGEITAFFSTGHAIGITTREGAEILIHVGKDTVQLKGRGFYPKVSQGDHIKQGDLLLEFEMESMKEQGYSLATPVIVTNPEDYLDVVTTEMEEAAAETDIITLLF